MIRFLFGLKKFKLNDADKDFRLSLRRNLHLKPKNIELYRIALIHKSASAILSHGKRINNERLEYLGDSILDAIVAEFLFAHFPTQNEGFLTKMRARIVCRDSLNSLAVAIGLNKFVVAQTKNSLAHKHIFGDALEALIGAIYLDKGYAYTRFWVFKYLFEKHVNINEIQSTETDYKSRIIELAQKYRYSIEFNSQEQLMPKGQNPQFETKLYLNNKLLGSGFGSSKKEAEQNAAMVALERVDLIPFPEQHFNTQPISWEN